MKTNFENNGSKKLGRREFLRLAGLMGSTALIAACVPQAPPQAAQPAAQQEQPAAQKEEPTAEAAASEVVTISWWNQFESATTQQVFPEVVKEFEALYPNIKVDFEISGGPPGGGDYIEVLLAKIAAGTPPDTITLWSPPSQFGARGSLLEIDDFMAGAKWANPDAFYAGPLNSCRWQGKTYGLPASAGAGCIFINATKFAEKGKSAKREDFPTTWADLQALSQEFLVEDGGEIKEVGFVPWTESWLKPVWSGLNGGKIFDAETGQYVVDSEENVEWLNYWLGYLDTQYGGDIEQFNLYGTWPGVYPGSAFNLGQAAMSMSGSWACTDAELSFDWEVMKFPVGPGGSKSTTGYWPNWWAMPIGTPHPPEGFLFCEYLCTQGWVTWYKAVMDTPAWRNFPDDVFTLKLVDEAGPERAADIHNFFATYLEDAVDMWNSPIEDFASSTLDTAIDEVLHKTKSPEEALAEAQELVQTKLQEEIQ